MDPITLALLLLLFILPALAVYQSYNRKRKLALYVDQLPGPKSYPVFGTTFDMLTLPRNGTKTNLISVVSIERIYFFLELWKASRRRARLFAPLFRSWFGSLPVVHMMKPEHLEVAKCQTLNVQKLSASFITVSNEQLCSNDQRPHL